MDEKQSLQRKSKHKRRMVACIVNSAVLIKQERQDDLRKATRSIVKRVEKCIEVDGGIFEHLL
jgi:deferrochelatase/peroxidase EfeB